MKKQIIYISLIAVMVPTSNSFCASASSCYVNTLPSTSDCPDCTTITKTIICSDDQTYCDCSACKNNASPTNKTIQTGPNTYSTISECPKSISIGGICPDECPSPTNWSDVSGENYQTKCDGFLLNPQCEYQCKTGYYGTDKNCTRCPAVDNTLANKQYGTSTPGSNSTITACFLAPGTYNDATGTFIISEDNCLYVD